MRTLVYLLLTRRGRCEMPHCKHRKARGSRYCPPHTHEARQHGVRWQKAVRSHW